MNRSVFSVHIFELPFGCMYIVSRSPWFFLLRTCFLVVRLTSTVKVCLFTNVLIFRHPAVAFVSLGESRNRLISLLVNGTRRCMD